MSKRKLKINTKDLNSFQVKELLVFLINHLNIEVDDRLEKVEHEIKKHLK